MKRISLFKRLKNLSYKERTSALNKLTMIVNLFWAFSKLILAKLINSVFLSLSGFYTVFIALAKVAYFDGKRHAKSPLTEHKYYVRIAGGLVLAGISYLFYFVEIFIHPIKKNYNLILAITLALVALCEIIFSVKGIIKSIHAKDLLLRGLKFINFCGALSSIALSQIALLSLSYNEKNVIYNTILGTAIGIITIAISCYMVIHLKLLSKRYTLLKSNKFYRRKK